MPFHQFDSFSGSIKESKHFQPLYPVSALPLSKATETTKVMFDSINTKPAKTLAASNRPMSTLPPHLAKLYKHYGKDIDKPVWLLGGRKDKIFFGLSFALFTYCSFEAFRVVRKIIRAEKNLPI